MPGKLRPSCALPAATFERTADMPKITKSAIDGLKVAPTEQWLWDSELPGFGVRCTPAGRKTYVARYRTKDGTQRKQVIARTCDMPPEKARDLARKVFAQVADGIDPMAERRTAAQPKPTGPTVESLFKAYAANMEAKGKASAGEVKRALLEAKNNAADALGRHKPACEVTAADVVKYVAGIFQAGHRGAADKHRSYIASAYTWGMKSANDYTVAERQDWGIKSNPAADVPRDSQATGTRDRTLDVDELRQLWQDTRPGSAGFEPETAACIRLLIACGQRVQETLRIDGCEIDLKSATWNMPAPKTKGRKHPHSVPLPKQVLPDLQLLIDMHGTGPLFPARAGSKNELIHHSSIMQAIDRWAERRGIAELQTRDIRRTWKSRAHDAGVDRFTRDLIQQHARGDTSGKHYDRAEYMPQMREAMAKWGAWMDANLEDKPALQLVA